MSRRKPKVQGTCGFCHQRENSEGAGKLCKTPDDKITAHYNCMLYSPRAVTRSPPNTSVLGGFDVTSVRKEIERGRRLICYVCKLNGASIGCDEHKCDKSYHYECVKKDNGEYISEETKGIYRVFCAKHKLDGPGSCSTQDSVNSDYEVKEQCVTSDDESDDSVPSPTQVNKIKKRRKTYLLRKKNKKSKEEIDGIPNLRDTGRPMSDEEPGPSRHQNLRPTLHLRWSQIGSPVRAASSTLRQSSPGPSLDETLLANPPLGTSTASTAESDENITLPQPSQEEFTSIMEPMEVRDQPTRVPPNEPQGQAARAMVMSVPQETMQLHLAQVTHRKKLMQKLSLIHQDLADVNQSIRDHTAVTRKRAAREFKMMNLKRQQIELHKKQLEATVERNAIMQQILTANNAMGSNLTHISTQISYSTDQVRGILNQAMAIWRPQTPATVSTETPNISTDTTPAIASPSTPTLPPARGGVPTRRGARRSSRKSKPDPIRAKRGRQ